MIDLIREWYGLAALITSGIISFYAAYFRLVKNKHTSKELLYQQMEELRIQVIESVYEDIAKAKTIARKDFILEELKRRCPECYAKVVSKIDES